MTTTPRRANRWTFGRYIVDRLIPQVVPGRHHIVWAKP